MSYIPEASTFLRAFTHISPLLFGEHGLGYQGGLTSAHPDVSVDSSAEAHALSQLS